LRCIAKHCFALLRKQKGCCESCPVQFKIKK